jgi:hypothetical protein
MRRFVYGVAILLMWITSVPTLAADDMSYSQGTIDIAIAPWPFVCRGLLYACAPSPDRFPATKVNMATLKRVDTQINGSRDWKADTSDDSERHEGYLKKVALNAAGVPWSDIVWLSMNTETPALVDDGFVVVRTTKGDYKMGEDGLIGPLGPDDVYGFHQDIWGEPLENGNAQE